MSEVGYVRVSTSEQADSGLGLEDQREKIELYARLKGYELIDIFVDAGYSGKSLKRPGAQQALQCVRSGKAQILIIAKLDRLTRSIVDLGTLMEELKAEKWELASEAEEINTSKAGGRLIVKLLGVVSEFEREVIGERTKDALAILKKNGVRLGGAKLGERMVSVRDAEGRVIQRYAEPDDIEMEGVAWARNERATTNTYWGEIIRHLNENFPREPNGEGKPRKWTRGGLQGALNG